jgi:heme/copper-type cytochrome/quinol oxidase subunit 4
MIYGRAQFALYAVPCVLNMLGLFLLVMGSAFRPGSNKMMFFGMALFLVVVVMFAFFAAARGRHLGWSPLATSIGAILIFPLVPLSLVLIGFLLLKPGKDEVPGVGPMTYVYALLLLLWPWGPVWIGSLLGRP